MYCVVVSFASTHLAEAAHTKYKLQKFFVSSQEILPLRGNLASLLTAPNGRRKKLSTFAIAARKTLTSVHYFTSATIEDECLFLG